MPEINAFAGAVLLLSNLPFFSAVPVYLPGIKYGETLTRV